MSPYDYIVVGAGSAGCACVNRLLQIPGKRVLLIEAGPKNDGLLVNMPKGFPILLAKPGATWRFAPHDPSIAKTETFWMRGLGIGGSSAINGLVYIRGSAADYDGLNVPGWGWTEVRQAYEEMEDHELGPAIGRGAGGPLKITLHPDHDPVCEAVIAAGIDAGMVFAEDMNQEQGLVAGYMPRTIHAGRRQSAAVAFLNPVRNSPELTIMTNTEVRRIVFDGIHAVGLEISQGGGVKTIRAAGEIILCAGALNTPKLLMLSGVGPRDTLAPLGIDIIADREEVGRNLSEQLGFMPTFRMTRGGDNHKIRGLGLVRSLLTYLIARKGIMSTALFQVGLLFSTREGSNRPNAIIQFTPASAALDKKTANIAPEKQPGASMSAYIIRPRSRGFVAITSADPAVPIGYTANYLADEQDRTDSIALVRAVRRIFKHRRLRQLGFAEITPGAEVETDEQIVDYLRTSGAYAIHGLGTCRMGADANSVVDPQLRVRGVSGLRVADLSVFPEMPSSHTNAPAMMAGWRAGQMVVGADADTPPQDARMPIFNQTRSASVKYDI